MPQGETEIARVNKISDLESEIARMRDLMVSSRATLRDYLLTAQIVSQTAAVDLFSLYEVLLEQERAVLTALNMLKPEGNLLFGFCWVP